MCALTEIEQKPTGPEQKPSQEQKPPEQRPPESIDEQFNKLGWVIIDLATAEKRAFTRLLLEQPVDAAQMKHIVALLARVENRLIRWTDRLRVFTAELKLTSNLFGDEIFPDFILELADIFMSAGQSIREFSVFNRAGARVAVAKEASTQTGSQEGLLEETAEEPRGFVKQIKETVVPQAKPVQPHPEEISSLEAGAKFISTDLWQATLEYFTDAKARVDMCPSVAKERTALAKMELVTVLVFTGSVVHAVLIGDIRAAFKMFQEVEKQRWVAKSFEQRYRGGKFNR